jgi:hypothetical protein
MSGEFPPFSKHAVPACVTYTELLLSILAKAFNVQKQILLLEP